MFFQTSSLIPYLRYVVNSGFHSLQLKGLLIKQVQHIDSKSVYLVSNTGQRLSGELFRFVQDFSSFFANFSLVRSPLVLVIWLLVLLLTVEGNFIQIFVSISQCFFPFGDVFFDKRENYILNFRHLGRNAPTAWLCG